MTDTLVLALDRMGCLQTARWSDVSRALCSPPLSDNGLSPVPNRSVEISNNFDLDETCVSANFASRNTLGGLP